jgi:hypothetical protein
MNEYRDWCCAPGVSYTLGEGDIKMWCGFWMVRLLSRNRGRVRCRQERWTRKWRIRGCEPEFIFDLESKWARIDYPSPGQSLMLSNFECRFLNRDCWRFWLRMKSRWKSRSVDVEGRQPRTAESEPMFVECSNFPPLIWNQKRSNVVEVRRSNERPVGSRGDLLGWNQRSTWDDTSVDLWEMNVWDDVGRSE